MGLTEQDSGTPVCMPGVHLPNCEAEQRTSAYLGGTLPEHWKEPRGKTCPEREECCFPEEGGGAQAEGLGGDSDKGEEQIKGVKARYGGARGGGVKHLAELYQHSPMGIKM